MTEGFRPLDDEGLVPDEDELDEGEWELDPNDPTHPDYDLSIAHGYSNWEPQRTPLLARAGFVIIISLIIVAALVVTILPRL